MLIIHWNDVIMSSMAYQITSLTTVYPNVYSGADQRKHQSPASRAFVRGIHRWPVNSLHKWPVTWKMFPFDDIIMCFLYCYCIRITFCKIVGIVVTYDYRSSSESYPSPRLGLLWLIRTGPTQIHNLPCLIPPWPINAARDHTMDLREVSVNSTSLYEIINFQSKASYVCSVTAAIFIEFCLKKLNAFFQHIGEKNYWISEFRRTNPQALKCWSTFCVNYFLRY